MATELKLPDVGDNIEQGTVVTVLVKARPDQTGVWAFHCHILNHAEKDDGMFGMVTALIVEN